MKKPIVLSPLVVVLACSPIAAELDVAARLVDPRISERKVYLRFERTTAGELVSLSVYLPKGDAGAVEKEWELLFESDEILRQTTNIARHNAVGKKIKVRGREVTTLRGRGLLVEEIRSDW